MKKSLILATLGLALASCASVKETKNQKMNLIYIPDAKTSAAPAQFFAGGTPQLTPLFKGEHPSNLSGAQVSFSPGMRSNWHTHPKGQLLVVTEGDGLIQQDNGPIQKIKKGHVIWTPPGVKHWHGASPKTAVTHIAIQEFEGDKNVEWLGPVTDDEYNGVK